MSLAPSESRPSPVRVHPSPVRVGVPSESRPSPVRVHPSPVRVGVPSESPSESRPSPSESRPSRSPVRIPVRVPSESPSESRPSPVRRRNRARDARFAQAVCPYRPVCRRQTGSARAAWVNNAGELGGQAGQGTGLAGGWGALSTHARANSGQPPYRRHAYLARGRPRQPPAAGPGRLEWQGVGADGSGSNSWRRNLNGRPTRS
jgi:hypothetical protein